MKVFELIKKLEDFDQDDEVMILNVVGLRYAGPKQFSIIDVQNKAFGGRVVNLEVIDI